MMQTYCLGAAHYAQGGYGAMISVPAAHPALLAALCPWHTPTMMRELLAQLPTTFAAAVVFTRDSGGGLVQVDGAGRMVYDYWPCAATRQHLLEVRRVKLVVVAKQGRWLVATTVDCKQSSAAVHGAPVFDRRTPLVSHVGGCTSMSSQSRVPASTTPWAAHCPCVCYGLPIHHPLLETLQQCTACIHGTCDHLNPLPVPSPLPLTLQGLELAARAHAAAGASRLLVPHSSCRDLAITLPPPSAPEQRAAAVEAFVAALWRAGVEPWGLPLFSAHQMGSCRMGSDPR